MTSTWRAALPVSTSRTSTPELEWKHTLSAESRSGLSTCAGRESTSPLPKPGPQKHPRGSQNCPLKLKKKKRNKNAFVNGKKRMAIREKQSNLNLGSFKAHITEPLCGHEYDRNSVKHLWMLNFCTRTSMGSPLHLIFFMSKRSFVLKKRII